MTLRLDAPLQSAFAIIAVGDGGLRRAQPGAFVRT